MLDLRRLRLLRELHERGTIAAVADALQFTPSAVSQQLAMLERETGVRLLERAGRGVRLTDPALVLVEHADALLERAALAEADLAAGGRHGHRPRRASPASSRWLLRLALPGDRGARARRRRGCAASSSRPSPSRRCPRSRSATSTSCSATSGSTSRGGCPPGVERHELLRDPVHVILPAATRRPAGTPARSRSPSSPARRGRPATPAMGWEEMTAAHLPRARRLRARHPPPRQRRDVSLALVAARPRRHAAPRPRPARPPPGRRGARDRRGARCTATIFAATRAADAARPSTQALLAAVRDAVQQL